MHFIFSEARRSLSFTLGRSAGRTRNADGGRGSAENNRSWLLAGDVQRDEDQLHSLIHFGVVMASEGDEPAAAAAASAADCTVVIRWRRLESSPGRCIPPAAGGPIRLGYSDIRSATRDFHPGRLLGRGAMSRVYKGKLALWTGRRSAAAVAIKRLQGEEKDCAKAFYRELVAGGLRHPNVVPLLAFCIDPRGLFLVYKLVSRGSLDRHLHPGGGEETEEEKGKRGTLQQRGRRGSGGDGGGSGGRGLSWEVRWKVATGIGRAVEYLHQGTEKCVIHRDIKPSNILLSSKKTPMLSDFGLATWTNRHSLPIFCKTVEGTFGYLAPEYFQHGKLSDRTDVFAFGVLLLELITGRKPIDRSRPPGDENLLQWAKPLLRRGKVAVEELLDPRLKGGTVSWVKLCRMVRTAAACLSEEEAARPTIGGAMGMLLQGEAEEEELTGGGRRAAFSSDSDGDLRPAKSDMRGHLTLAMLGVSDADEEAGDRRRRGGEDA
ncbi:unnamed protein product [Spirodela intermedia]|uniref:Protein kinase domain-containing protein n=1 Tax=Spirodela intermedia TaxID=51605 RepID=A0A7I8J3U7_SPIIN|nr:unnamed protein product [Spirodela intermedia]CAA6664897.1 unnamed protein product [Spirodela intermedia]